MVYLSSFHVFEQEQTLSPVVPKDHYVLFWIGKD